MVTERSYYSILGVDPSASPERIRQAYRELARQLHPDMASQSGARTSQASSLTMAEVNRAWTVLSDPVARREYDKSRRIEAGHATQQETSRVDPQQGSPSAPLPPVRFPWRAMVIAGVIGSVIVLVLNAFSDPPAPGVPDQLLEPGSCVVIDRELFAVEVSCASPHEYVVRQFIAIDRSCPADSESFKDRQGMGLACVDAVSASTSVVTGSTTR